jgi:hypothetical protein
VSDIQAGARAPDAPGSSRQAASQAADAAGRAATNVTDTAKHQARQVADEASTQARNVAGDVRAKVSHQARTQNDRLVDGIRGMADELDRMRADRQDSPAAAVVSRVASGGRQVADYLADRGPEGVLDEVQDFARRRPGAFLATALVAGFVVGRLGKGALNARSATDAGKPRTDAFVSDIPRLDPEPSYPTAGYPDSAAEPGYPDSAAEPGYPAGTPVTTTEYASTGTGTPVPVAEPYPDEEPPVVRRDPSTRGGPL